MFQTERPNRIRNRMFPSNEYYKYEISSCFFPFSSLFLMTCICLLCRTRNRLGSEKLPHLKEAKQF
jgi:hypothetical protein